jgi:hypothetical protein
VALARWLEGRLAALARSGVEQGVGTNWLSAVLEQLLSKEDAAAALMEAQMVRAAKVTIPIPDAGTPPSKASKP